MAFLAFCGFLQIAHELKTSFTADGLEQVRLIRDKRTGQSRQFAFAKFATLRDSKVFLEMYYPSIQFRGSYGMPQTSEEYAQARLAYSREKEDRDRPGKGEGDWMCENCGLANYQQRTLCFRCHAPRMRPSATGIVGVATQANVSAFSGVTTTGDSDVSPDNQASQFLLFRNLEPGVTEELLAKAMTKLYRVKGSTTPPETQANKKPKMMSTSTDANLGAKEGSLMRVFLVRDRKTNESWRYGFAEFGSVDDAQAAMAKYNSSDKFTISSKPVLASYIHAGVFVPVLQALSAKFEKFTFSPLSNPAVKLMYWDEGAFASEMTVAREASADTRSKENPNAKLAAAAAGEGLLDAAKGGASKKRKAGKEDTAATKKIIAPHLKFWSNQHAELHGLPANSAAEPGDSSAKEAQPNDADAPPTQTFADPVRKCCLLCSRQFKTDAEVNKHERLSQLHRDNMLKEDLVEKALAKLGKLNDPDSAAYRDRAQERRKTFNQPKQPSSQHKKGKDTAAPVAKEPSKPVQSKGAALLGKMGWTAGEGLGAQGTGRTEAIETHLYAQGVGLGAQGGKVGDAVEEANRATGGSYADFVSRAKDKAKERFEQMS
ncbi:hypothetical protein VC83_08435 [Pseudogymnoascus destructans]|uniref:RNA-binding protein n=2 Tax=Pseudogymnoascus destructans TaxID=655981 RepID=L8FQ84_PSED2|nr:uncharacterized protein VC83_08435 [Pseudogymnoascus destructans]ELR02694.1 hypothetical protein GMDG_05643 [Pseudogymnoascus destructans 20631-21]OAF55103.2 hypothetical protein VC83_08435 [Pseudogymnoascus destructans]